MVETRTFYYFRNPIRVADLDGEPWFVGGDIASILGCFESSTEAVLEHVDSEDRIIAMSHDGELDHDYRSDLVNVFGVCCLFNALDDNEREDCGIKEFKHWLQRDVIPFVRNGGVYLGGLEDADEA